MVVVVLMMTQVCFFGSVNSSSPAPGNQTTGGVSCPPNLVIPSMTVTVAPTTVAPPRTGAPGATGATGATVRLTYITTTTSPVLKGDIIEPDGLRHP